MNKRIDQLIDDARLTAVAEMFEVELTKFAELIVRECGTVINSENYREHSKGWNDAIEWADGMIKEHFGVEE
jgi:hypothetical protein